MSAEPETASAIPQLSPFPAGVSRHRLFSIRRVIALAGGTFTQLVRMKVFYFMAIFSVIVILSSFAFAALQTEGQLKLLKDISLAAMSLFSMLFAVAGTALLIPRDLEDRILYTILCKPVPRIEYLLGKLLGVGWLILISLLLMDAVFSGVLYLKQQAILNEQIAMLQATPYPSQEAMEADIAETTKLLAGQGLHWGLQAAVFAIFLKSLVLTAITLLISTFASSTIFTIMTSLAVMVIGQAQSLAREAFLQGGAAGVIPRLIAGGIALLFPDFKVYDVIDAVIVGNAVPVITLVKMCGLTGVYLTIHMLAAYFLFSDKEL